MVEGESKLIKPASLLPNRPSVRKYTQKLHPVPEELSKSTSQMERQAIQVGFLWACVEAHIPYKLNYFPNKARLAAPLLNFLRENGIPIVMQRGMKMRISTGF